MARIITYSLRLGARNSDDYCRTIAAFADRWLEAALRDVGDVVEGFRDFRRGSGQPDRPAAECAFELLVIGVLLRQHGAEAACLPGWSARWLGWLVAAPRRWPWSEGAAKALRGWVGWLARKDGSWRTRGDDVGRLIEWLRATGDSTRAERLAQWQEYLDSIDPRRAEVVVARCLALAAEFAREGMALLGAYTEGVERFLAEVAPKYRQRYDAQLLSRTQLEYHLGMLGTELLSRAYRARFLAARRKVVILPPCMRAQPEEKCKAIQTPLGARCQACTPSCRVHQITKLGEKRGFEVYMIPDELRVFGPGVGDGQLGLVGVSCALTNWSGGWEADSLGIPAQGVLLDYVGCAYHWDEHGIPTDTNIRKLAEVMGDEEHG